MGKNTENMFSSLASVRSSTVQKKIQCAIKYQAILCDTSITWYG